MLNEPFKQLKTIWDQKLKESGFVDIENTNHPEVPLNDWHTLKRKLKDITPDQIEATQEYYTKALHLLSSYEFENETHRSIWVLHTAGKSKRKIEKAIKDLSPSYKREQIANIIKIIEGSML